MNTTQYLYDSPSTSAVQFGRLDPTSKKDDSSQNDLVKSTNETLQKAESFAATQTKEVTPTVNSNQLLDTYA